MIVEAGPRRENFKNSFLTGFKLWSLGCVTTTPTTGLCPRPLQQCIRLTPTWYTIENMLKSVGNNIGHVEGVPKDAKLSSSFVCNVMCSFFRSSSSHSFYRYNLMSMFYIYVYKQLK
jgi:hypothetical protein